MKNNEDFDGLGLKKKKTIISGESFRGGLGN